MHVCFGTLLFPRHRGGRLRDGSASKRLSCLEGFEASWWVKVYGQSPNPLVPYADIYLALALSGALSWVLGVQNRIMALKAFLV